MFENYNNLTNFPNNMNSVTRIKQNNMLPYAEYNAKDELVGYTWFYGETLNLIFNLDGFITVENDSIIYNATGQEPDENTIGIIGQKAYNIIDLISWELISIEDNKYNWVRDNEFTYPINGGKQVYFTAKEYLKDKTAEIKIFDFEFNQVFSTSINADTRIILPIDKDLSSKLIKGNYYLTLTLNNDAQCLYIPIIKDKECLINIK